MSFQVGTADLLLSGDAEGHRGGWRPLRLHGGGERNLCLARLPSEESRDERRGRLLLWRPTVC